MAQASTLSDEELREKNNETIKMISLGGNEKIISKLPPTDHLFCLLLCRISYLQFAHRNNTIEALKTVFFTDSGYKCYIDDSDLGITGRIILNRDDILLRDFFKKNNVKDVRIYGQDDDWMVVIVDRGTKLRKEDPWAYVVFKGTVATNPIEDDYGPIQRLEAFSLKDWKDDFEVKPTRYPDNDSGIWYHHGFLERVLDLNKSENQFSQVVSNVVKDPLCKNAIWIVTGHSLGGGVSEVYTNLVNSKNIMSGMLKISRCVTFAPAPAIVREKSSCLSEEIYTMYINGDDPVARFNGDNLKDWAFDWVRRHCDPYGDVKPSLMFRMLNKLCHHLLGFPFDVFTYSHGYQKAYYRFSEHENQLDIYPEELSVEQRCDTVRFVEGFPILNGFCHWHATGSYEYNMWRKHQFSDRPDERLQFKKALEPKDGALADVMYNYLWGNLDLKGIALVFKLSFMEFFVRIFERVMVCLVPAEISIGEKLLGNYWPFKNGKMN